MNFNLIKLNSHLTLIYLQLFVMFSIRLLTLNWPLPQIGSTLCKIIGFRISLWYILVWIKYRFESIKLFFIWHICHLIILATVWIILSLIVYWQIKLIRIENIIVVIFQFIEFLEIEHVVVIHPQFLLLSIIIKTLLVIFLNHYFDIWLVFIQV